MTRSSRARGAYSGALGYFGLRARWTSRRDPLVAIAGGGATVGGGGAVTVLSDAEAEHAEMLVKVDALLRLLEGDPGRRSRPAIPVPSAR